MFEIHDLNIIKKYCENNNTEYLKKLTKKGSYILKKIALYVVSYYKNNKVGLELLSFYNLDKDGKIIYEKEVVREKAEEILNRMSIMVTGARKDDILSGTHKGTYGAIMKVHTNIYPSKNRLNILRYYKDIWDKFLLKLGGVNFFTKMTKEEREIWLEVYEDESDFFIDSDRLELLQPGVGDFKTKSGSIFVSYLPSEDLNRLMSVNTESNDGYWSPSEINNMIIEYTGKSSTLVILKSFWKVSTSYEVKTDYNGMVIDIFNGKIELGKKLEGKEKEEDEILFIKDITNVEEGLGLLTSKIRESLNQKKLFKLFDIEEEDRLLFNRYTEGFTAAAYKSLLQKIIRFMPKKISLNNDILVDGDICLKWCLLTLISHPGAFVPNIQRFVSGLESTTKRLAVTLYEDSSVKYNEFNDLLFLLASALVSQRVKEWKPTKEMIKKIIDIGIKGYNNNKLYIVDYYAELSRNRYKLDINNNILKNCSAILDELKSFPTDLGLARGWARDYPNINSMEGIYRPEIMPLLHCIDQHWAPSLIYYYNDKVVKDNTIFNNKNFENTNTPFFVLFKRLFHEVTGVNSRRVGSLDDRDKLIYYTPEFEDREFVKETRKAQEFFRISLQDKQIERKAIDEFYLKYTLESSWLSGMIGVIKVKLKGVMVMVTLKTDDPLEYVVTREPRARRGKTEYKPLTVEQEEQAIIIVKDRLRKGVLLNKSTIPADELKDSRVYLKEEKEYSYYEIRNGKVKKDWDEIRNITIKLNVYEKGNENSISYALKNIGYGVEEDYEEKIKEILKTYDKKILRRVLIYISTANRVIEIHRVNRDGGGTYQPVNIEDVSVFQFLLKLSVIIPGGIRPVEGKPATFYVPCGPLLWSVKKIIKKYVEGFIDDEDIKGWNMSVFKDKRKMFSYQNDTVNDMIKNNELGLKGQFLWLPVGTGKTKIVLTFLEYLKNNNKLSKYIIYTLPPESVMSIIEEIKKFGIKINVMIPLKNISDKRKVFDDKNISVTQGCKPKKYHINLILHDHLRHCMQDLPTYAGDSFIIFDEVHLFLNQSQRTGMGMTLSHLSKGFVSFTGTPIVDNKTEKLITWLEQIVPFEVNKQNFWVAANSMIAKKISTGIKTESYNILAPFNISEQGRYQKLVPPAVGGVNTNPSASDWLKAIDVCYEACDRRIITLTKEMLEEKRGVMIVANNTEHQYKLYNQLLDNNIIKKEDIFLIQKDQTIFLTDEAIKNKKIHNYRVVIVPKRKAQGYTLTALSVMITSVYPSNNATREQLAGRINRMGQKTEPLLYYTIHIGILTTIMEKHSEAKSISAALQNIAEKI